MSTSLSIPAIYEIFKQCTGICTDTRKITKDCLYVSLKGANFNGNIFASQALAQSAKYALIDEKEYASSPSILLVHDCLETLQKLAHHHRMQFNIPFIGITGSNGKTTSKELISCVLQKKYKTHFTSGNLNNHIGVPLTLLSMPIDTEIAVIEMGANHIGEIEFLTNIAAPTHGLITNIGKAHLEGFGSLEGVARAKSELFKYLQDTKGTIFINGSSDVLMRMGTRFDNPLIYSQTDPKAYVYGTISSLDPFISIDYKQQKGKQTQLIGTYNFENILAALAIAKQFGIADQEAVEAICNYLPSNNRSQVIEQHGIKILLDAYNANPSSMAAAVENLDRIEHPKKIAILGDMFELGDESMEEHQLLYEKVSEKKLAHAFFVGKNFKKSMPESKNIFENKEELMNQLKSINLKESLVLIKGSRGIGLETILDDLN